MDDKAPPKLVAFVPVSDEERHYKRGWKLIEGAIILHGKKYPRRASWYTRWRVRRAERSFLKVIAINPANWPALWALGKIKQRLGDHSAAYDWFIRSHRVKPDQPDVAREASIAAMDSGRHADALELCRTAVHASPSDAGLRANLALALLMSGDVAAAREQIDASLATSPDDGISKYLAELIGGVESGRRRPPRTLREIDHSYA